MPGYKVVKREEEYTQTWLLSFMKRVAKDIKHMSALTDELFYTVRQNEVMKAYEDDNMEKITANPWLMLYMKKRYMEGTFDDIMEAMRDVHYYPSVFDLNIMARLAHVNVVLIGRVTRQNPDGFEVLYHGSPYFVIMQFAYDRKYVIDRFHVIANIKEKRVLFRQEDTPIAFLEKISEKMVMHLQQ